jgi:hypothetical protein
VKLSWRATALEALFGTLCARSGVSPSAGVVFWPFFGLRPKLKVALMSFSMTFSKESFHKSDPNILQKRSSPLVHDILSALP